MKKVAVFGLPGTGKSTLACRLAADLGVPHHDLDRVLFTAHGPLPLQEFRAAAAALAAGPGWVIDGNYAQLADITWHRADAVIWLDYTLPLIVRRIAVRSVRRAAGREPASRIGWRRAFFSRRALLYTAVRKYVRNRRRYASQIDRAGSLGVQVLRFRTPRQAEQWLSSQAASAVTAPAGYPHPGPGERPHAEAGFQDGGMTRFSTG